MITKIGFPSIMLDNDMRYLSGIFSIVEAIDESSDISVCKTQTAYSFTIVTSIPVYNKPIINAITRFHKELGLEIEFSRSQKISRTISFYLI
jgi:hypothetical protein